jgi:hypothetical protein
MIFIDPRVAPERVFNPAIIRAITILRDVAVILVALWLMFGSR